MQTLEFRNSKRADRWAARGGKLKKKKKKVGDIREEVAPEKNTGQYIGFCFYIILFNP